jgi:hypothetical protein
MSMIVFFYCITFFSIVIAIISGGSGLTGMEQFLLFISLEFLLFGVPFTLSLLLLLW